MPALQDHALSENPNRLNLTEVATYERQIKANITRVWENVLDWEHLPWLHDSSFNFVSLIEAGDWGWRTWSNAEQTAHVELCIDRANNRYVARSYSRGIQDSEIWTRLEATEANTNIAVSFKLRDIKPEARSKLGKIFLALYTRLWDEDETMMCERQRQLNAKIQAIRGPNEITLGNFETYKQDLPKQILVGKHEWLVREYQQEVVVHAAHCPHLLGPLVDVDIQQGRISCPWHGYEFDINTGDCMKPDHAGCRLPKAPSLIREADQMILRFIK